MFHWALLVTLLGLGECQCPWDDPTLTPWAPGDNPTQDVVIDGVGYLLTDSANLNTITISNGGRLVINDNGAGGAAVTLRTRQILILTNGVLEVGSEACPYQGNLEIVLWGMLDDGGPEDPGFGRKFIGCAPTGNIMLHGKVKASWTRITATLNAGAPAGSVLDLADDMSSWEVGDRIVLASSDYDEDHTEEFTLVDCPGCTANQVAIQESPVYSHNGGVESGADMRAEVGLLSRNVVVRGEVEPTCYGSSLCDYAFTENLDLFGGQLQMLQDFNTAHISDIELVDMGQQTLGAYPIHFHRTGPSEGGYAKRLSIHHSRSRCVTLHGAQHVVVEDVVGYHVFGHCFFLEDGFEYNNTLRHNLGLVTKHGALLPSDRDAETCLGELSAVYPGYTPVPEDECMGTSVFWITHPDNIVEDNAAVGGDFGFFHLFHREPTSGSVGELPPYHGERSPLASFARNTAHSNSKYGMMLDRGVKTTPADATDPREMLALADYARYAPHEDRNLSLPRVPAILDQLTTYKTNVGLEIRGGDIIVKDSHFVDNVIGARVHTDVSMPYDIGSHLEIVNSHFNGRSQNMRNDLFNTTHPQRGMEYSEGPVVVDECVFSGYLTDGATYTNPSAIGFKPNSQGQHSARNTIRNAVFLDESRRLWLGEPGGVFGDFMSDGDQSIVLVDVDGSVSGVVGAHITRRDINITDPARQCTEDDTFNAAICTGYEYIQMYAETPITTMTMYISSLATGENITPYELTGVVPMDEQNHTLSSYQALLVTQQGYAIDWDGVAPELLILVYKNGLNGTTIYADLCYPSGTTFEVYWQLWDQLTETLTTKVPLTQGNSVDDIVNDAAGLTYYWDAAARRLHVKILQRYPLSGYNYCSDLGCEGYEIQANIVQQDVSDCRL